MMRSLWTAASGMITQQTNVDTISNNLANINTTGYKKETAEFKTLLYQTIQETMTDSEGNIKPTAAQVGLGVRNSGVTSRFTQGTLNNTDNPTDFAIMGNGFFMIQMPDGSVGYTRSGAFQLALHSEGVALADSSGNTVLDSYGSPIIIDPTVYNVSKISVDESGNIGFPDQTNNVQLIGVRIGVAQFMNPAGLEKTSGSMFKETAASGEARLESLEPTLHESVIKQKFIEASNVQAVDEMVNLIVAQRAYEMNSKAITASDTMLGQANNLRN